MKMRYFILSFALMLLMIIISGGMVSAGGYTDHTITTSKLFYQKNTSTGYQHDSDIFLPNIFPEIDGSTAITYLKVRVKTGNYTSSSTSLKLLFGSYYLTYGDEYSPPYFSGYVRADGSLAEELFTRTGSQSTIGQWYTYEYSWNPNANQHIGDRKLILSATSGGNSYYYYYDWTMEIQEIRYRKYNIDYTVTITPERYVKFTINKPAPITAGILIKNTSISPNVYVAGSSYYNGISDCPSFSSSSAPEYIDSTVIPGKTYNYTMQYIVGNFSLSAVGYYYEAPKRIDTGSKAVAVPSAESEAWIAARDAAFEARASANAAKLSSDTAIISANNAQATANDAKIAANSAKIAADNAKAAAEAAKAAAEASRTVYKAIQNINFEEYAYGEFGTAAGVTVNEVKAETIAGSGYTKLTGKFTTTGVKVATINGRLVIFKVIAPPTSGVTASVSFS